MPLRRTAWMALALAGMGCAGDDAPGGGGGGGGGSTASTAGTGGAATSSSTTITTGTGGGVGSGGGPNLCGNGNVDATEQCDDANATLCDGCEDCGLRNWLIVPAGAYASVPSLAADLGTNSDACYEAWAKVSGGVDDAIYLSSTSAADHSNFILRCQPKLERVAFAAQNGDPPIEAAMNGIACGDGAWHHVAGCRKVDGVIVTLALFWDGEQVATARGTTSQVAPAAAVYIGGVTYAQDGLDGAIDEVRISKSQRYTTAFTPQRRFPLDADTLALFHLDEGTGATFTDASSSAYAGAATGTSWATDTGFSPAYCQ